MGFGCGPVEKSQQGERNENSESQRQKVDGEEEKPERSEQRQCQSRGHSDAEDPVVSGQNLGRTSLQPRSCSDQTFRRQPWLCIQQPSAELSYLNRYNNLKGKKKRKGEMFDRKLRVNRRRFLIWAISRWKRHRALSSWSKPIWANVDSIWSLTRSDYEWHLSKTN